MKKDPNIEYLYSNIDGPPLRWELSLATPIQIATEMAFREAYYRGACEVVKWRTPDRVAMDMAWEARKVARRKAGFWYRKEVCILYYPNHSIEAARTRGFAQALWMAAADWDNLKSKGHSDALIRSTVIRPWFERIKQWANEGIPVHRLNYPRFPFSYLSADQKRALGI